MKVDMINLCVNSQHYRDITYMIDMIKDTEVRVDVIKQLGYKVILSNFNEGVKSIHRTNYNKILIQITPIIPIINKTRCVIFNKKDLNT